MSPAQRFLKQAIIAVIFLSLVGGIGYAAFRAVSPPPPTPTPDPLAGLSPLAILSTRLLNAGDNDYDLAAKVHNPNAEYGSAEARYELKFYNFAGTPVSSRPGEFYILPGQTKHIIISPLQFTEPISRAELTVTSVDWQKLSPLAAGGANLIAHPPDYQVVNRQGVFSRASGTILNHSDYDLGEVDVAVLVYDSGDNILAVHRTAIRTFIGQTTRGYEVSWFKLFPGTVARLEVEPHTNLFLNSNFLRQYQQPERFQQFY